MQSIIDLTTLHIGMMEIASWLENLGNIVCCISNKITKNVAILIFAIIDCYSCLEGVVLYDY